MSDDPTTDINESITQVTVTNIAPDPTKTQDSTVLPRWLVNVLVWLSVVVAVIILVTCIILYFKAWIYKKADKTEWEKNYVAAHPLTGESEATPTSNSFVKRVSAVLKRSQDTATHSEVELPKVQNTDQSQVNLLL